MHGYSPILAYFSPETMLPATSLFATLIGLVMMFGKGTFQFFGQACRRVVGRTQEIKGR